MFLTFEQSLTNEHTTQSGCNGVNGKAMICVRVGMQR